MNAFSVQEKIEQAMSRLGQNNRWESMILFTHDGLPMAQIGHSTQYPEDKLLECAMMLLGTLEAVASQPVRECVIRGEGPHRLVFRLFEAGGETLILAIVGSSTKGYFRAMNQVVHAIEQILTHSEP